MAEKRHTKDFRIPGKVRYEERNPRGENAEWIDFACTKDETDAIMYAIGAAIQQTTKCELPAGTLLTRICREWCELQAEIKRLRDALELAYEAMNYLGDTLNKHDMVEPENEAVTNEAFDVVSKIIKEQALKENE